MAKRIPAGSKLIFQVHYTPIGTPQTDRSQVGFIYGKADEVKQQMVTNVAGTPDLSFRPTIRTTVSSPLREPIPRTCS